MICLPVSSILKGEDSLSVHFLVDPASPATYLSKEALKALNKVENSAFIQSNNVNIWGTKLAISQSK
jgi:hypothetical protein